MKKDTLKRLGMQREFANWLKMVKNFKYGDFEVGDKVYLDPIRWHGYSNRGISRGDMGVVLVDKTTGNSVILYVMFKNNIKTYVWKEDVKRVFK